jgi:hypothetical protein
MAKHLLRQLLAVTHNGRRNSAIVLLFAADNETIYFVSVYQTNFT